MRLSESIRKNIMEVSTGGILNRFKIKTRRSVLFFEDIFANYIKECEKNGYGDKIKDISEECSKICSKSLMPSSLKIMPPKTIFNVFISKVWENIGVMDKLKLDEIDGEFVISTKYESITRIIGPNNFMKGFHSGTLASVLNSDLVCTKALQNKTECKYFFKKLSKYDAIAAKDIRDYERLNRIETKNGITLKNFLRGGVFKLSSDNKIYFRGKIISPVENTIFHLLGEENILFDRIPEISNKFFSEVMTESSDTEKLNVIKNILQAIGWGEINIVINNEKVDLKIKNPPYGFQLGEENWNFLLKTIEGYLWMIDRDYRLKSSDLNNKILTAVFKK